MNIEEANPAAAIRLAGDKIGYFHIGESNRGYLGDGVIDFDRSSTRSSTSATTARSPSKSFSGAIVDEALSIAAASGATPGPTTCRSPSTPRRSSS